MELIRTELARGVRLSYLPSRKFKTGMLSANFVLPVTKGSMETDSLLGAVLRRGSERYGDMKQISEALDLLYGAQVTPVFRRKSERCCIGFTASCVDDAFVPGGMQLLESTTEMLFEILLHPALENGVFRSDYVQQEKDNLLDAIRSRINDKREWADYRLMKELCAGEAYGLTREEEDVLTITPESLFARWREVLETAPLELFYCGSAPLERVEKAMRHALRDLPRGTLLTLPPVYPHVAREEVQRITERMDVTQGKLAMGFSCTAEDVPAMILANTLFGGSSNSKLFMNVREKLSLCYYASSGYHRSKGLVTVSSGVEFANFQRAFDEIMLQLEAVQNFDLEDWELSGARSTVRNAFRSYADSQRRLEDFTLGESVSGEDRLLEDYLHDLENATEERIQAAAKTVRLDTAYFLTGKEANA
ncbi:MAG: insulinase family protein [Oscillospiraceae bacterium]|nr:insulinase family protein [Oscillospiraceae bacterium]